ncbi:META domain-containing protein [Nitrincola sp. MINF-07-Sa-05]|uniref:META domain-containing protein n=1 Tax=Nitrincola salilacus TaxID=3400273 RepID=UPI003917DCF4
MMDKKFNRWLPMTALVLMLLIALPACTTAGTESGVQWMTLEDTQWKLLQLRDEAVPEQENMMRHPVLAFLPDGRVAGSDGCNRLMGGYQEQGRQLSFTQMASTRMACVDGMEVADSFNYLIALVRSYEIKDDLLELFSDSGELLMRFQVDTAAEN